VPAEAEKALNLTDFERSDYPRTPGVRRFEKLVRFSTITAVKAGWLVETKGTLLQSRRRGGGVGAAATVAIMDGASVAGRAANKARWDEAAPLHAASDLYDLAGFEAGRDDTRPFESIELGPVSGRDLIHLQCHLGTDTLSWARRGARVVGLDFSPASLKIAAQLAADCDLSADFVCADVYDALDALGGRSFDIVYTGIEALGWLPDLDAWARGARSGTPC
jgi:2-polyprenyl-3-methyl-5-hydroxy-6-metoxy-1,4-benzoquinol methylase